MTPTNTQCQRKNRINKSNITKHAGIYILIHTYTDMFAGDQKCSAFTKPGVQPALVVFYDRCASFPFAANLRNIASLLSTRITVLMNRSLFLLFVVFRSQACFFINICWDHQVLSTFLRTHVEVVQQLVPWFLNAVRSMDNQRAWMPVNLHKGM